MDVTAHRRTIDTRVRQMELAFDMDAPDPHYQLLAQEMSQQQFVGNASDHFQHVEDLSGWSYAAITANCKTATTAESEIYDKRVEPGISVGPKKKDQGKAHEKFRWWQLLRRPSPWQSGRQLMWERVQQLSIHGISLVWNVKDGWGKTLWRIPIPVVLANAIPPQRFDELPNGGIRVQSLQWMRRYMGDTATINTKYHYAADRIISIDDITLTAYPHPWLRGDGLSPMQAGKSWIDLAKSAEESASKQYKQGGNKRFLLEAPEDAKATTEKLIAWTIKMNQWLRDAEAGVVGVVNSKGTPITTDPDQMEYVGTSELYGPAIMSLFATPKAAVGMGEGMTYGSLGAMMRAYAGMGVQPTLNLIADEDTNTCQMEEGPAFTIEYPIPQFDDPEIELKKVDQLVAAKALTKGRLLTLYGYEPYGDERDEEWAGSDPAAMQAMGQMGMGGQMGQNQGTPTPNLPAPQPSATEAMKERLGVSKPKEKSLLKALSVSDVAPATTIAVSLDSALSISPEVFDGSIGEPRQDVVEVVTLMHAAGCGIVVFTCRDDNDAVATWLDQNGIPYDGINDNPYQEFRIPGKSYSDVYLGDSAVNASTSAGIIMQSIIGKVDDEYTKREILSQIKKRRYDRKYGVLMLRIESELLELIQESQAMIDPSHLSEKGLESEPHITILYGLVDETPERVKQSLQVLSRPEIQLGKITQVMGRGAVVVPVISSDLEAINQLCQSSFAHIDNGYSSFRPHITLGYVKPEFESEYDNRPIELPPVTGVIGKFVYRHPTEPDVVVPLLR